MVFVRLFPLYTDEQGCEVVVALPRFRLRLRLRLRPLFFIIITCPVGSDSHYKSCIVTTTPGDSDSDSTTLLIKVLAPKILVLVLVKTLKIKCAPRRHTPRAVALECSEVICLCDFLLNVSRENHLSIEIIVP